MPKAKNPKDGTSNRSKTSGMVPGAEVFAVVKGMEEMATEGET